MIDDDNIDTISEMCKPRRIIVCCDGTACTSYEGDEESPLTNVSRISRCIKSTDRDGIPQIVHYLSGIGTAAGNPSNGLNQAFGIGINEKIMEAYNFICHNYATDQDQIILIGFSRGAFIVRCIADLIHNTGLLMKSGLYCLRRLYDLWSAGQFSETERTCLEEKGLLRINIRIKACAVWDTVKSLGIPRSGLFSPPAPSKLRFVHSDLCDGIDNAFHALSLHEHRQPFLPLVWRIPETNLGDDRTLKQCWFMGYHADIGGGNKDECLAHFALAWIISNLADFVDFDFENFWKPHPGKSSWKVSKDPSEERPFRVRVQILDPMNIFYWLGGSISRKPCRQFWDRRRFNEEPPGDNASEEYMHTTVRLLTRLNAFQPCSSLRGIEPTEEDNRWVWRLSWSQSRRPFWNVRRAAVHSETQYEVFEDNMSGIERTLLWNWLNSELDILQENSKEKDPEPGTLIHDLMEWLFQD